AEGIVDRRVYPETPVRVEYSLTDKGRALAPVMQALHDWANSWMLAETVK
ncbi:MAG: winged helix-turn-helix transcriptional regulator, partial [Thermaerobacter sp.]|nr:winged helix-turn-helix transcriptional regulator [Thermaerobacter sp.]